jgi:hypothetical protein
LTFSIQTFALPQERFWEDDGIFFPSSFFSSIGAGSIQQASGTNSAEREAGVSFFLFFLDNDFHDQPVHNN